jgi:poly(3-hydroxybutyrate) depolymerase
MFEVVMKLLFLLMVSFWTFADGKGDSPAPPLRSFKIDAQAVSISGISSGGFMAMNIGVAHSKAFSAVANVAGGVYWCSQGQEDLGKKVCMGKPELIDTQIQISEAMHLSLAGQIDPVSEMKRQKIYMFHSPKDRVILPGNAIKTVEFYKAFIPEDQIKFENSIEAAHGFPTLDKGIPCHFAFLPWIIKCHFDLAGEILSSAYGPLAPHGVAEPHRLSEFNQWEFGDEKTPLHKKGWVYVPRDCETGSICRLHVALHGCQMNPDYIQDRFVNQAGYNEWAENNRIIVLYPQSGKLGEENPYACWDWWGFTGPNYVTQSGAQTQAIMRMVHRLMNGP